MSQYNLVVIGAGIAGLYTALQYLKKHPASNVAVLEKYKTLGGRVITYHGQLPARGAIQWENGAGRIHSSHKLILELIKDYGLHTAPIQPAIFYKESYESGLEPNRWESHFVKPFIKSIRSLSDLGNLTFLEALQKVYEPATISKIIPMFPYWSEIHSLRADLAIESFEREMGTHEGYAYCKEGYSAIIDAMIKDIEARGGQIMNQSEAVGWNRGSNGEYVLTFLRGSPKLKDKRTPMKIAGKKLVFALHAEAFKKMPAFRNWQLLRHIEMQPLLRCYAVFPKNTRGVTWCADVPRFVTETPLRYYIPIDPAEGVVMISYTDGADARKWLAVLKEDGGEYKLRRKLVSDLRKHFPDKKIPDPLFFKTHPWFEGCSYWKPGKYDPAVASRKALTPFGKEESIYCCGESFSMRQAWMEGALEHAKELEKILAQ